jgi:hypothetical protein
MNDKYIICDFDHLPSFETNFVENNVINNTIKTSSVFDGSIENAGCSEEVTTQENHILTPVGGTTTPKNIVFQTDGSNSIYGSFFRDDTLTNPKGDVRGSGANDLSVSRDLCSQVASGAFSSILSGQNNTASSEGSIVIGGNNNIADSSNCLVIGGINNISGGGFNNGIITGSRNSISRFRNDISNIFIDISNSMIMTGTNIIMNGNSSVFVTGKDISGTPIVPGTTNLAPQFRIPYSNSAIVTGLSNTIIPVTPNLGGIFGTTTVQQVFIGTGRNNKIANWHPILTGSDITFGFNGSFLPSFIYTGKNISNKAITGSSDKYYWNVAFMSSENNIGDFATNITRDFGFLPGSRNNNSGSAERTGGLIGGIFNRLASFNTAILTGSNIQTTNNQGNTSGCSFFGTGINQGGGGANNVFDRSTIITGSNNSLISGVNNGYICGRSNVAGNGSVNMLLGGGSNNTCGASLSNFSIISGTTNSITTSSRSVIGSGISNVINGSFNNSFMTGIAGLLSTPAVTSAAVFGQSNLQGAIGTPSSNRLFMIGNGSGTRRNAFSVTENGVVRAQRVFATGGADFAEFFKSYQGSEKLPLHESVCLIDDRFLGKKIENGSLISSEDGFKENDLGKIILSSQVPDEIEPFGVVTNNSSYIGNSYDEEWQGKYEKDDKGNFIYVEEDKIEYEDVFDISYNEIINYIQEKRISENGEIYYQKIKQVKLEEIKIPVTEEISVYDEHGQLLRTITEPKKNKIITKVKTKKISESYNPNQIYIPRKFRPEWNLIGLRGQVLIKKGQRLIPKSTRIGEYNQLYEKYLI